MATSLRRLAGVLALTLAALLTPITPASAAPAAAPVPGGIVTLPALNVLNDTVEAAHPLFGNITIRLPDLDVSPS